MAEKLFALKELQNQARHQEESRKMYSKCRLRELYNQMLQREMEARRVGIEKEQRVRAQFALDYKIQQRQNEQVEKFREHQVLVENLRDKCNLSKMFLTQTPLTFGIPLSRADCNRRQALLNQDQVYSRAEPKHHMAVLRKMHLSRKLKQQSQEEYFNKIAAKKEVELKNQERHKMIARAKFMALQEDDQVGHFNRMLQKKNVLKDHKTLVEPHPKTKRNAQELIRQCEEEEKARLKQLFNQALAGDWAKQIGEKQKMKQKQVQQEKMVARIPCPYEFHTQEEHRNQAPKKKKLWKIYSKYRLGDLSYKKLCREMETSRLDWTEENRLRGQFALEHKIQQTPNERAEKFRNHQLLIENVRDKLAVTLKEQDAAKARKEEEIISHALAKQDALMLKKKKEEEEKRSAMIKSIAAYRERVIQKKKEKEQAERRSNLEWLEAQKEADKQFHQEKAQKAQRAREIAIECRKVNDILIAQQRAYAEKLKREEEDELRTAEQLAERAEELEQN
ncbi:hypothetical protein Q5P01_023922 [Channa striata]|uniref:Trichohyalin-plectin-homology domain-containing protein n=1 Tax=Channa striata TaxID=64152 RepID=A0AA88J6Y5_CHASR|nr:hypothetical protein Q5P01_023922 [Channa striata]